MVCTRYLALVHGVFSLDASMFLLHQSLQLLLKHVKSLCFEYSSNYPFMHSSVSMSNCIICLLQSWYTEYLHPILVSWQVLNSHYHRYHPRTRLCKQIIIIIIIMSVYLLQEIRLLLTRFHWHSYAFILNLYMRWLPLLWMHHTWSYQVNQS